MAGGDDTITATNLTYGAADIIVDGSSTDNDTLTVTTTTDITAAPLTVGVENVNFTSAAVLAGGNTTLSIAVDNLRGAAISADLTNDETLVDTLAITGARDGQTITASDDFSTVSVDSVADADVVVTLNNDDVSFSTVNTANDGVGTDLSITAAGDVTITATVEDGDLTVVAAGSAVVTAANSITGDLNVTAEGHATITSATAAAGDVNVTAGGDVDVTAAAAEGSLNITAGGDVDVDAGAATGNATIVAGGTVALDADSLEGDVTVTSTSAANSDVTLTNVLSAEGTVTVNATGTITVSDASAATALNLDNTGATAGDDIVVTDARLAEVVEITSVGAVTATANTGLAVAETVTVTAAEASAITVGAVADQVVNLNAANEDGDATTFTLIGDATTVMSELNLGGSSAIIVAVLAEQIDETVVTSTNTAGASIFLGAEDADITNVASNVNVVLAADFDGHTLIVDNDTSISLDTEVNQTATGAAVIFDHATNATTSTSTSLTLGIADSVTTNNDNTANAAGLTFTDVQALTIAMGTKGLTSTADITGADLRTVTVTGSGAFNLGANTITGNSVSTFANVSLNASAVTGVVTVTVDDTANGMESVTTGSAADVITIGAASASGDAFIINTNGGADTVIFAAAADAIINGGTGTDTVRIAAGVDLSASDITFTSIERIELVGGGNTQTIAASFISGAFYILAEDDSGTANLTISMDQLSVDLSNLAAASSFASGTDTITIDASGLGVGVTITGSGSDDIITGTASADTISSGAGANVIDGGRGADIITLGAGSDTVVMSATRNGNDTIIGFTVGAGATGDVIQLDLSGLEEDASGNADVDLINIDLGTSSIVDTDAIVLSTVTGAFDATALTTATSILVANLAANIASASALETALEDGGALEMTADGVIAAKDGFLVLFDNGTNSFLAHVESAAGAADDGHFAAGDLTATIIATLVGVADVTTLVAANFEMVA